MSPEITMRLRVRDVVKADIPILTAIKGMGTEVIHRDRLRDARDASFRYLVLIIDQGVIGFACLVYRRPSYWSDADDEHHLPQDDEHHLPQIVDLQIRDSQRGRGYGSRFIRMIEKIAAEAGSPRLYLSVDPINSPRAQALYLRLDYQPLQRKPYRKIWQFTDSQGNVHRGEDWIVDYVKELSLPQLDD